MDQSVRTDRREDLAVVKEAAGTPLHRLSAQHPALVKAVRSRLVDSTRNTTSVTPFQSVMG